jgi:hypothetical protein
VQVRPKAKAVKTKPLAEAVTTLILERATDARLIWDSDKQVRIAIGEIIPFTVEQTTSNRRKRFRANLKALLEPHGWRMTRANNFEHE